MRLRLPAIVRLSAIGPALTVMLAVLGQSAPASARAPLLIGIQDDPVFVRLPSAYGGRGADGLLPASAGYRWARRLGVNVVRITVQWATVMPGGSPQQQEWARYDAAIAEARARGFVVQLDLAGPAPQFATGDRRAGYDRPSPQAFGEFARDVASRYRGLVGTYSIWNEPNWWFELQPKQHAPSLYRRIYEAGYAAIKRAQPGARVLIGELAPLGPPEAGTPPLRFLRALTCRDRRMRTTLRCRPLIADGFALHPYTLSWQPAFPGRSPDDVTTGSLPRLIRALRALARVHALSSPSGAPLPVYLTEYGWHARYARIPEPLRARYAVDGYTLAYAHPQVKEVVWYELAPPPQGVSSFWDTALLTPSWRATFTFEALHRWIAAMRAAGAPRR